MAQARNIPSILHRGILCHRRAQGLQHVDLADSNVQALRHGSCVPGTTKTVHDYVPLYFATHTPTQYALTRGTDKHGVVIDDDQLVFLDVDPLGVFEIEGVVFTDGNAASAGTRFFSGVENLCQLDWDIIHRRSGSDPAFRRKKAAEVLVPDVVPVDLVNRVVIFDELAKGRLRKAIKKYELRMDERGDRKFAFPTKFPLAIAPDYYYFR